MAGLDFDSGMFSDRTRIMGDDGYYMGVDSDGNISNKPVSGQWIENTATLRHTLSLTATSYDIFFRTDGLKFYIANNDDTVIEEWTLTSPWNISTATLTNDFDFSATAAGCKGVSLSDNGSKLYIGNAFSIYEYDLSTAWDISTAVHLQTKSIGYSIEGLFFRTDGYKLYAGNETDDYIAEIDLSTAWDISTAVHLQTLTLNSAYGVYINPDGDVLYASDSNLSKLWRYDLGIKWDINSAVNPVNIIDLADTNIGISMNTNGTKLYWIDFDDELDEYDLTVV